MTNCRLPFLLLIFSGCLLYSCTTLDFTETSVNTPQKKWESKQKPELLFTLTDTTASYGLFLVLRHNEAYRFNNIWIQIAIQQPNNQIENYRIEKILASNEMGWLGSGLNDIYEHRIPLALPNLLFKQTGRYKIVIEQIMREDPLQNIISAGLRLEKKPNS